MLKQEKFGIIVEARTGSKRYKEKVLKKIYKNTTVLEFLIKRLKKQKLIKKIIVATTTSKNDARICKICKKLKVNYFRGNQNNLIKRVYSAAQKFDVDHIVQVTSDNPFFDESILNILLKKYKTNRYEFVSNSINRTFPIGLDLRIFSRKILGLTEKKVLNKYKEHTCYYFIKNLKKIKFFNLKAKKKFNRPDLRLTLDYSEDLNLFRILIKNLGVNLNTRKIINFLDKNPEYSKINSKFPKHYE